MNIAYLTSLYARASDSFIRGEVAQLRKLGHVVYTFSIRKPDASQVVSDDVRREFEGTDYLLSRGVLPVLAATLRTLARSPGKFFSAFKLARRLGVPGLRGRLWPIAYLLEACLLAERLKERRIDHLHNHIGENSAAVAMLASLLSGVPFSMTVHGPGEFDQAMQLALAEKIHRSAFTVAISEYGRSQLMRWCARNDWEKLKIVHCGVDPSFLSAPAVAITDVPRFVCIGRLCEQKGQLLLVEAAAELQRGGIECQIVLVGDGPMRAEIEGLIARHHLEKSVRIAGWAGADRVREEILAARAMVLPSFAEGLPVVIMEALALRRPVISTYVAGIPELVKHGVNGWLVPAGSVTELVAAMKSALLCTLESLEKMGEAGALCVKDRHDPAKEAQKLELLIFGKKLDAADAHFEPILSERTSNRTSAALPTASVL